MSYGMPAAGGRLFVQTVTPLNITGIPMENETTDPAQTRSLSASQRLEQTTEAYKHLRKDLQTLLREQSVHQMLNWPHLSRKRYQIDFQSHHFFFLLLAS